MSIKLRSVLLFAATSYVLASGSVRAEVGARISLPICDKAAIPSNFAVRAYATTSNWTIPPPPCPDADTCRYWWSEIPEPVSLFPFVANNLDWGDDNVLFSADGVMCGWFGDWASISVGARGGLAPYPIAHVHGFFNNVNSSTVWGQVTIAEQYTTAPLTLAIQVSDGVAWHDVSSRSVSTCDSAKDSSCWKTFEIATTVPGNSDVRLELRSDSNFSGGLMVAEATLFGTECFPDVSNPGMCLH